MGKKNRKRFRRVNIATIHQFPKPPNSVDIPPTAYHATTIECKKNIYNDYISAYARNTAAVNAYRQKYDIIVGGSIPAPDPIETFDEMKETIPMSSLLKAYGRPSPILSQALPIILSGHDMIGLTKSGPERTLSYIIPAILHIHQQQTIQPEAGPAVLILTHSLEHGERILQIASLFGTGIRMALFSGGSSPRFVRKNIEPGIELVIACADTANTLLNLNKMNLKRCSMIVFDDVDAQILKNAKIFSHILKFAPAGRQLICFSQTWWEAVGKIVGEHMPNGHCSLEVGKLHRDVHRICRQQVHILKKPENRMQYTLNLIRKIQTASSGKILVFALCKEDSITLAKYLKTVGMMLTAVSLNEIGTSEEIHERIESFRIGSTNCLITTDRVWMTEGIEHVVHFGYTKVNYGMRLSHMTYSRTGGTSHIILYNTEHVKSVIEDLTYGNQEISAELLEMIQESGSTKNPQAKADNQIPTIEISDDETETLKVIPKKPDNLDLNDAGAKQHHNIEATDICSMGIANNNVNSLSRKKSKRITPNFRVGGGVGAIKRPQSSRDLMPLMPETKKQKPDPSTTDKWSGADVILERILIQEESINKVLSANTAEKPTLPLHETNAKSPDLATNSGNSFATNHTATAAYSTPFLSTNLQSMNLSFRSSAVSTNSHLDSNANSQMNRNKNIRISPWKRRDDHTSTANQFMSYGNFLNEPIFAGNNVNSYNGQMIYQRRSNL